MKLASACWDGLSKQLYQFIFLPLQLKELQILDAELGSLKKGSVSNIYAEYVSEQLYDQLSQMNGSPWRHIFTLGDTFTYLY